MTPPKGITMRLMFRPAFNSNLKKEKKKGTRIQISLLLFSLGIIQTSNSRCSPEPRLDKAYNVGGAYWASAS